MSAILSITYEDAVDVTQSDSADDPNGPYAGFYVGVTGDVKVTTVRGSAVVMKNCQQGTIYPVAVRRIWTTGTTATNIEGMRAPPWAVGQGVA